MTQNLHESFDSFAPSSSLVHIVDKCVHRSIVHVKVRMCACVPFLLCKKFKNVDFHDLLDKVVATCMHR